jgi:hypothetical protein
MAANSAIIIIKAGEWSEEDKRAYRIWDNQSALLPGISSRPRSFAAITRAWPSNQNTLLVQNHRHRKAEPLYIIGDQLDLLFGVSSRVPDVTHEAPDLKPHNAVRRPQARPRVIIAGDWG